MLPVQKINIFYMLKQHLFLQTILFKAKLSIITTWL